MGKRSGQKKATRVRKMRQHMAKLEAAGYHFTQEFKISVYSSPFKFTRATLQERAAIADKMFPLTMDKYHA